MGTVNTLVEFTDYEIDGVNYFINAIQTSLNKRDLPGLTNDRIQMIPVSKEHPLVMLMASKLNENKNLPTQRANAVPAIGVTPGNRDEDAFTLGESAKPFPIDDEYIEYMRTLLNTQQITRIRDGLVTNKQLETIISEYRKAGSNVLRGIKNSWSYSEEINISVWSDTADIDVMLSKLVDAILAKIRVGDFGDGSAMRNMKYKVVSGLTNFNYGRVLYGTEFNLTFLNTYSNYTITKEALATDMEFVPETTIPGVTI